jgi:hypothetical protein
MNDYTKINVSDLLGTGLSCIVWNSTLPKDTERSLKYIDLMSSKAAHHDRLSEQYGKRSGTGILLLLNTVDDKLAGTSITKLHFPRLLCFKTIAYDGS